MPLPQHSRTNDGTFRRERSDSTARELRKSYPEFNKVRADAQLGTIKKKLYLPADAGINKVRAALRKS